MGKIESKEACIQSCKQVWVHVPSNMSGLRWVQVNPLLWYTILSRTGLMKHHSKLLSLEAGILSTPKFPRDAKHSWTCSQTATRLRTDHYISFRNQAYWSRQQCLPSKLRRHHLQAILTRQWSRPYRSHSPIKDSHHNTHTETSVSSQNNWWVSKLYPH